MSERIARAIAETEQEALELAGRIEQAEKTAEAAQAAFSERLKVWRKKVELSQQTTLSAIASHSRALVETLRLHGDCVSHRQGQGHAGKLLLDLDALESDFSAKPISLLDGRFGDDFERERQALRGLAAENAKQNARIGEAVQEKAALEERAAELRRELDRFQALV